MCMVFNRHRLVYISLLGKLESAMSRLNCRWPKLHSPDSARPHGDNGLTVKLMMCKANRIAFPFEHITFGRT